MVEIDKNDVKVIKENDKYVLKVVNSKILNSLLEETIYQITGYYDIKEDVEDIIKFLKQFDNDFIKDKLIKFIKHKVNEIKNDFNNYNKNYFNIRFIVNLYRLKDYLNELNIDFINIVKNLENEVKEVNKFSELLLYINLVNENKELIDIAKKKLLDNNGYYYYSENVIEYIETIEDIKGKLTKGTIDLINHYVYNHLILREIKKYWYDMVHVGHGYSTDIVRSTLKEIEKLKKYLNKRTLNKISDFFIMYEDDIIRLFKYRYKRTKHKEYLKILYGLLSGNLKKKVIQYVI